MKIALAAPSSNVLSETFVRRHRNLMHGDVTFYYGGYCATANDIEGDFRKKQPGFYLDKALNLAGFKIQADQRALKRSFKKMKIEVCYAEFGPTGVALMDICEALNIPLIVNFHGYDISMNDVLEQYTEDYRQLFQSATQVIGVSIEMCAKLENLGCPPDKIRLLPCAPDPLFFDLSPDLSSGKLLCVGRFVDKKAPYLTLLAFRKVLERLPGLELIMIGDGPLLNCCENLAKALDIANVTFTGALPHDKTQNYFTKCSLYVQHSVTARSGDKEGTPVTIMEASAMGLPIISTLHAGIPDIVLNGETGYLVEEFDYQSMAEKIIQVMSDKKILQNFSKAATNRMKQAYYPEKYEEELNQILKQACQQFR